MRFRRLHFHALLAILCGLAASPGMAQTIVTLGSGFSSPGGVAVDGSGNVYVADTANSAVKEIVTAGGQVTVNTIATGFGPAVAVAIDGAGDIFAIDGAANSVFEIVAVGGYATARTIATGFNSPKGIAVDGSGNVFVADIGIKEIVAAGGYGAVVPLGSGLQLPDAVAVDSSGNVFLTDIFNSAVEEIPAAGGYATVETLVSGLSDPAAIAVDGSGNVFFTDQDGASVLEISAAGGYATVKTVSSAFSSIESITVDGSGNLFVQDNSGVSELPSASGYTPASKLGAALDGASNIAADAAGNIFLGSYSSSGVTEVLAAGGYNTVDRIHTPGLSLPSGVAVDGNGNVFVADTNHGAVKELVAAGGYATVTVIGAGFSRPSAVALDAAGNLYVADTGNGAVTEVFAGGYASQKVLSDEFSNPIGVAINGSGTVFVADSSGIWELSQAGALNEVVSQSDFFSGVALDKAGDLFLSNNDPFLTTGNEIRERPAANGFKTVSVVGSGFDSPQGVAVDGEGNVFVADSRNNAVKEVLAAPPVLVAAVLPGSRSVQAGATATVFATMINTGTAALNNCQISSASTGFGTLPAVTMSYQTTDPTTNALTGEPNTPVTIPGNSGMQSFLLSFQTDANFGSFLSGATPLDFTCGTGNVVDAAAILPGVDTLTLSASTTPVADVIALAATPTNNGIVDLPTGGVGAFAVATINIGAAQALTVSTSVTATLPVTAMLCQTDPVSGHCFSPPTPTVPLSFVSNATPTFSVFLTSTGPIAFDPANARVGVQFLDSSGGFHGSTSVAIETH